MGKFGEMCSNFFAPLWISKFILPEILYIPKYFLGKKLGGCFSVDRSMRFWTVLDENPNFLQGPRIKKFYFRDPP